MAFAISIKQDILESTKRNLIFDCLLAFFEIEIQHKGKYNNFYLTVILAVFMKFDHPDVGGIQFSQFYTI